jgi:RNA polymerase sigma-70 factor (ECF subfamily)
MRKTRTDMAVAAGVVTELLAAWSAGDESARDSLMPLVYDELRRLARRQMRRERPGHTLQTTALVNEAYLRMAGQHQIEWQTRAHFFAMAAAMMRRILVDHARRRQYAKRGGGAARCSLDDVAAVAVERSAEIVAVDEALTRLSAIDERGCRIVEMRYFGGLTVEEIGSVLHISAATVKRDWTAAKGWLAHELRNGR